MTDPQSELAEPVPGAVDWSFWAKCLLAVVAVGVLAWAVTSPMHGRFSPTEAWELAALLVTFSLCAYIWLDIWFIGPQKIRLAIDSRRSGLFLGCALILLVLLIIAVGFALAPWPEPFADFWELIEGRLGRSWYGLHATVLFGGAVAAASLSWILAVDAAVSDAAKDSSNAEIKRAVSSLEREIIASRRAFWFADIPACLAFAFVCLTVWAACLEQGSMTHEELKAFIGGSVAMSLVLTNAVHVSLRWKRDGLER